jgi:hypothetical protein
MRTAKDDYFDGIPMNQPIMSVDDELARVRAENDRLREALTRMLLMEEYWDEHQQMHLKSLFSITFAQARAALDSSREKKVSEKG